MPNMPGTIELTPAQGLYTSTYSDELTLRKDATYATYRAMRKDPTLALARALSVAPVTAADWSIEADDDAPKDADEFIQDMLMPMREPLVETAMFGGIDFGWAPFEKVFEQTGNEWRLRKIKPLLQDPTVIMVLREHGEFDGFKQDQLRIPVEQALNIPFRVEGTNWYGASLLENARAVYTQWQEANDGAARYDRKLAGALFLIWYPSGKTISDGVWKKNKEIAEDIANAMQSGSIIRIPRSLIKYTDELNDKEEGPTQWKIEMLSSDGSAQASFCDRLRYLDSLKVRGLLMPERALLEGQYGNKAEAGEHADLALVQSELTHRHITRHVNWYVVDDLLAWNYDEKARGTVRLIAAPLIDEKQAFFREVYKAVLADQVGFMEAFEKLDMESLIDAIGIPRSTEVQIQPNVERREAALALLSHAQGHDRGSEFGPDNGRGAILGRSGSA